MTRLAQTKLALTAAALVAFAWGVHASDRRATWVALALLASAFVLRFAGPRPHR